MRIMFGKGFLSDPNRAEERALWRARLLENRKDIWRAVNGVIKRRAVTAELPSIKVPTLVVVGEEDVATVPAKAERLHQLIPGSRLVRLPRGGHSVTVEEPALVNATLGTFLDAQSEPAAAQTG
jgi:pimeloyl-ACP methyl ester carboxylesterase